MSAQPALQPLFKREAAAPALPPALEEAIDRHLEASPAALAGLRLAAAQSLRRLGLPHSRSEDYSFLRVGELLPHLGPPAAAGPAANGLPGTGRATDLPSFEAIAPYILPEARENLVVLLDGAFVPSLSRLEGEFSVLPYADSAPPDSPLPGMHLRFQGLHAAIENRIAAMLEEETDAPAALAALFAAHPLLVRVPAKRVVPAPLQILHLTTGALRSDAFILVHAGTRSESRILVRHARLASSADAGTQAPGLENVHTLAWVEDGASLRFMEQGVDSPAGGRDLHLRKFNARLERDARLLAVSAHTGSRLTRAAFGIDLAGEGADAELNGATVLAGARQGHQHVVLRHLAPHGTSRQNFKTVVADQSRASVDGTIHVALDAQQTNAAQLINNLMLSDEARADCKPRLMIHADDVKCAHGATSGKLDPAQQFYLESRGLPPARARSLLTVAFVAEALEKAGKAGEAFRDGLDHALLDALRERIPGAGSPAQPASSKPVKPSSKTADGGQGASHA
jgi:Fe-S cluster assembly protein SufD